MKRKGKTNPANFAKIALRDRARAEAVAAEEELWAAPLTDEELEGALSALDPAPGVAEGEDGDGVG